MEGCGAVIHTGRDNFPDRMQIGYFMASASEPEMVQRHFFAFIRQRVRKHFALYEKAIDIVVQNAKKDDIMRG